jgi:hypothetical protein
MAVKIKRNPKPVPQDIDGCVLVPLAKRQEDWPSTQAGLIANTFYRIDSSTKKLRCMVTVMPDGLRLAWDSCGKCHEHVIRCKCRSGIYHCSSVGFIRATYDHDDWPGVRITDYTAYFDPFGRRSGKGVERSDVVVWNRPLPAPPKPPTATTEARRATQKRRRDERDGVDTGLTVKQIEDISMAALQKTVQAQVAEQTKQVRRIIKRKRTK